MFFVVCRNVATEGDLHSLELAGHMKKFTNEICLLSALLTICVSFGMPSAHGQATPAPTAMFAIKPLFDWVGKFKGGFAAIKYGGKYGFIDKQGQIVIKPRFDDAKDFSEGLARVRIGDSSRGKWGFIDRQGEFVIAPQFDHAENFSEGLAIVRTGDFRSGKYGFIDKNGIYVINPIFDTAVSGFSEGLVRVAIRSGEAQKWGYIDRHGRVVINLEYDWAGDFSDGVAEVSRNGKLVHINKQGMATSKSQFDSLGGGRFADGLKAVMVGDRKDGKWGYVNTQGDFIIKPQFDWVRDFSDGLAAVLVGDHKTGKWGYINTKGNFVINPQFREVGPFQEGFASVRFGDEKNAKWGYVDRQGNVVIPPQLDNNSDYFVYSFILDAGLSEGLAASCIIQNEVRKCGFISKKFMESEKFGDQISSNKKGNLDEPGRGSISLDVIYTEPDANGMVVITIKTNADTASLKINAEEHGGRADGNYIIKKLARAGATTEFNVVAKDVNGNKDSKTITVQRSLSEGSAKTAALNPTQVKKQPERDAVAIVIGIAEYRNLPKADYANEDARIFYDYAIRALGIKPENIKLLIDGDADQADIYQAFKTWLPSRVRSTTDVYVFYSGHGLPAANGQELYLLPQRAHRDLVEETAISMSKIGAAIQAAKPQSVTVFLDSCYSGLARTGETLLASARPVVLKADKRVFPDEFTVITASQADQISSSSPDLKHGIFSYYLMRGMEGEADINRDGKITAGEMHGYLAERVTRQAGMLNRRQDPQLVGDANRVLVGQ